MVAGPDHLRGLVRRDRLAELREEPGGVLSALPESGGPATPWFEGLYGAVYDRAIRARLRAPAGLVPSPVADVTRLVAEVVGAMPHLEEGDGPVLLDVPSGGGTLLPLVAEAGFTGTVVEADLATAMLRRAAATERALERGPRVGLLRADATDLPLRDGAGSAALSLNGLHVMPEPGRFLAELARCLAPGAPLGLVTLVTGALTVPVVLGGRLAGILPVRPPRLGEVRGLLEAAGFVEVRHRGGIALAAFSARRAAA